MSPTVQRQIDILKKIHDMFFFSDTKSHIHIQVTDGNIKLETLAILEDGKEPKTIPLTVLNEKEKLYVTELQELPTSLFKLEVSTYQQSGIKRRVENTMPGFVSILSNFKVFYLKESL